MFGKLELRRSGMECVDQGFDRALHPQHTLDQTVCVIGICLRHFPSAVQEGIAHGYLTVAALQRKADGLGGTC